MNFAHGPPLVQTRDGSAPIRSAIWEKELLGINLAHFVGVAELFEPGRVCSRARTWAIIPSGGNPMGRGMAILPEKGDIRDIRRFRLHH